ncbi:contact-dependent growth inhibition system immunity protein [Actinacidiphila glaucinigra]|uniref:contact-dependent growth inhibition system immunity protein n=1 Tax=Actinacidiphila glaucinigra TaxID=235986 RepID=UPI00324C29A3
MFTRAALSATPVQVSPRTACEIWWWDDCPVTRPLDRDRSLEELERDCWPDPRPDATRLITTAHTLRRRPIGELTVEDMRLLIGQDIGLPYLLPLAVEVLRENPMAEGHMYEGDLLSAVLTRTPSVWAGLPELDRELRGIVPTLTGLPTDLQQKADRFLAVQGTDVGAVGPAAIGAARTRQPPSEPLTRACPWMS